MEQDIFEENKKLIQKLVDEVFHELDRGNSKGALNKLSQAKESSISTNDQHWLTYILHEELSILSHQKEHQSAFDLCEQIINGYLKTFNIKGLALILIHKANFYAEKENYQKALKNLKRAEAILDNSRDQNSKVNLFSNISVIYQALGDFSEALAYLEKMLLYLNNEKSAEKAWCLQNIANCHLNIYNIDLAKQNFQKAYQIYQLIKDSENIKIILDKLEKLGTGHKHP